MSRTRAYQGVTAYTGLPGSGKTYTLAHVGVRALKAGRQVWTNPDVDGYSSWLEGGTAFRSFDEFAAIPNNAIVCWDELPLFANARKWQDFPDNLLYRLTQIRKDGLQLHFSTIDWRMVDVNVRRITFWVWECQHIAMGLHVRRLFPPEERRRRIKGRPERQRRTEFFTIRRDVRESYDTFGKVATFGSVKALPSPPGLEAAGKGDEGAPSAALTLVPGVPTLRTPPPPRGA